MTSDDDGIGWSYAGTCQGMTKIARKPPEDRKTVGFPIGFRGSMALPIP